MLMKQKKMKRNPISGQTRSEEIYNAISHSIGVGLSFAALVILVVFASQLGDPWKIVSFSIYGVSLVILYSISTLYHILENFKSKKLFQILDQSFIFILIAGSYTPFLLVNMRGFGGWVFFSVIWTAAIVGILLKTIPKKVNQKIIVAMYFGMGWLVIIALHQFVKVISSTGLTYFFIGGAFYTLGVIFYFLDQKMKYAHFIFHLFVLGGSIFHFFAMLLDVLKN